MISSWLAISSDKPAKSLVKANCLAFSKLISAPSNISAASSFFIEVSKSSKLFAIASTPAKLVPNKAALVAASARSSGLDPKDTFIEALALATSSKTPFTLIPTPACFAIALAVSTVSLNIFSVSLPCSLAIVANEPAADSAKPSLLVNIENVSNV